MEPSSSAPPQLIRPKPRRPFQLTSDSSAESSHAATPPPADAPPPPPAFLNVQDDDDKETDEMERSRSIMNLTSSTLFGIYAPTGFDSSSMPQTPWGTGAETPARQRVDSVDSNGYARAGFREQELDERLLRDSLRMSGLDGRRRMSSSAVTSPVGGGAGVRQIPRSTSAAGELLRVVLRIVVLVTCGLAYGALIAHLHDDRRVSPVRMEGFTRDGWRYLAFWATASVASGLILPWVDSLGTDDKIPLPTKGLNGVEWNDVVRSVGAFIGVAYAIRKTPWSSPLQLSLTLTLVNPFLWYLLDRTPAGFSLSFFSGLLGVAGVLLLNPSWVPAPTHSLLAQHNITMRFDSLGSAATGILGGGGGGGGREADERVGSAIWIGSVFFCSCICFGNIGRLLAPGSSSVRQKR